MNKKLNCSKIQLTILFLICGSMFFGGLGVFSIVCSSAGHISSSYPLLENGGFEDHSNYHPWPWWRNGCQIYSVSSRYASEGSRILKVKGIQTGNFSLYQDLGNRLSPNQTYYPKTWVRFYYGSIYIRFRITTIVNSIFEEYTTKWQIVENTGYCGDYLDGGPLDVFELGNTVTFYIDIQDIHPNSRNRLYLDDVKLGLETDRLFDYNINWEIMEGEHVVLSDVGVGYHATIDTHEGAYSLHLFGHILYYWDAHDKEWKMYEYDMPGSMDGHPQRIDVIPYRYKDEIWYNPIIVTDTGHVYEHFIGEKWNHHDELRARDIGCGAVRKEPDSAESVYAITYDGKKLKRMDVFTFHTFCKFADYDIKGTPIRVDVQGNEPWIITDKGYIYKWEFIYDINGNDYSTWFCRGRIKHAVDIGINGGYVYVSGKHKVSSGEGWKLYRHHIGNEWYLPGGNGAATQISVDKWGDLWVLNIVGEIYHGDGRGKMPILDVYAKVKLHRIKTMMDAPYGIHDSSDYEVFVNWRIWDADDANGFKKEGKNPPGKLEFVTVDEYEWHDWYITMAEFKLPYTHDISYKIIQSEIDWHPFFPARVYVNSYKKGASTIYTKERCDMGWWVQQIHRPGIIYDIDYRINTEPSPPGDPIPSLPHFPEGGSGSGFTPPWHIGESYFIGDVVTYNGWKYECIQAHTAYASNWAPPFTPALWKIL